MDADLFLSNAGIMLIGHRSTEDLTSLCPLSFRCSKRTGLESGEKNSKESKCPLFQILENGENELNGREMSTPYELGESGEKELNGRDVSTLYELVESGEIELNRIEVSTLHELEGVKKMNSTRQAI